MAVVNCSLLWVLLKRSYGPNGDIRERLSELALTVVMLFSLSSSNKVVFLLASALSTAVMAEHILQSEWSRWATPPIALQSRILIPSFMGACLIHVPSLVSLIAAIYRKDALLFLPQVVVAVLLVLIRVQHKDRVQKGKYRFCKPLLEGSWAYVELLFRRMQFPLSTVIHGVFVGASGFVLAPGSSPIPWVAAGCSFGSLLPIIYRERDDIPARRLRKTVRIDEVWGIVPRVAVSLVFILLSVLLSRNLALIPSFLVLVFVVLAGRYLLVLEPTTCGNVRFIKLDYNPSILSEFFVEIFSLAIFASAVWFFYQIV